MAAISKSLASTPESGLRPFDVRRDLDAVANLVELCFSDTLDPDGRDYLLRMRSAARNPAWLSWSGMTQEWGGSPMSGYVWLEEGRVVGNASLVPYFMQGKRFYLIANVAVHPDYRGRGIARRLTERALEHARQRQAPSTWLQVREENEPAVALYHSLGFQERARRTTWVAEPGTSLALAAAGVKVRAPAVRHWEAQRTWLLRSYPDELSWHMPFRLSLLRPGLFGGLYRFLMNVDVSQWAALRGERLMGVLSWQPSWGYANHLWLAAPPDGDRDAIRTLLAHACQRSPLRRALALDYPARQYENELREVGFEAQQTLIWMELK